MLSRLKIFFLFVFSLVFIYAPSPGSAEDKQEIVIGVLSFDSKFLDAQRGLVDGLQQLGYEKKQLRFVIHDLEKDLSRIPATIGDLRQQKCTLIMTTTTPVVLAVQKVLRESDPIPVVFTMVADPVALKIVPSLQRPGGFVTGVSYNAFNMIPKRLEVFRKAFPDMKNIAVFYNQDESWLDGPIRQQLLPAAKSLGFQVTLYDVHNKKDMIKCSRQIDSEIEGLFMVPDPQNVSFFDELVKLSRKNRFPIMVIGNKMLEKGGIIGYGPSFYEIGRQAAMMVYRILNGTSPGKLPIQNPNKVQLVVSLEEAKQLGLSLQDSFLMSCDTIIR